MSESYKRLIHSNGILSGISSRTWLNICLECKSERNVEMLTSTGAAGVMTRQVDCCSRWMHTYKKRGKKTTGGEGASIQPHTSIHLINFLSNSTLEDIPVTDHICLLGAFEKRSCFLLSYTEKRSYVTSVAAEIETTRMIYCFALSSDS